MSFNTQGNENGEVPSVLRLNLFSDEMGIH
jgi:hypothetical protein